MLPRILRIRKGIIRLMQANGNPPTPLIRRASIIKKAPTLPPDRGASVVRMAARFPPDKGG